VDTGFYTGTATLFCGCVSGLHTFHIKCVICTEIKDIEGVHRKRNRRTLTNNGREIFQKKRVDKGLSKGSATRLANSIESTHIVEVWTEERRALGSNPRFEQNPKRQKL
jgi:hypothetical protein